MIKRETEGKIRDLLQEFPAVAILGPRQVGKTTIAQEIANHLNPKYIYLDLESPADRAKITEAEAYFELHKGNLIILDEIQRIPNLFEILRGVIDRRRKEGHKTGQFLILGSASLELLKQSSETLAGRIAYTALPGLTVMEVQQEQNKLWLRGGFPDSFLAKNDEVSLRWRLNFIDTYLERDVPQFAPRIPSTTLRRMWTMLAHQQGAQLNTVLLGANLDISSPTTKRYLALLEDLLLIRTLRPWSGNVGKRLVKSPKVYIRDSGIVHALLHLKTMDDLLAHPVVGASWEGFVLENLVSYLPLGVTPWFYRTSAGAEIDLVMEWGPKKIYAIEIKRSMTPTVSKGFHLACEDVGAVRKFIVYPGSETYPHSKDTTVISLIDMIELVKDMSK
jgi:predicted AAA+ superfamily ATPase